MRRLRREAGFFIARDDAVVVIRASPRRDAAANENGSDRHDVPAVSIRLRRNKDEARSAPAIIR
jgi:hypothetical protein